MKGKEFWISCAITVVLGIVLLYFSPGGPWWIEMLACCTVYVAVSAVVRDVIKLRAQAKKEK